MRNIPFNLVKFKANIFLSLAVLFSLLLTAGGTSSASVNPQLSGGGYHSLALKSDGTVWTWGKNDSGQLGNGTTSESTIPVQVLNVPGKTDSFSGVTAIAGGWSHSAALKSEGTVWAWGQNDFGQLGNGTTGDSTVPVQVSNLSGITTIASGGYQCLALKSDGTVLTWGRNDFGQLGNGSTGNSNVPVQVNSLSGIIALAGGGFHCLALKSDGTVWAWGRNDFGQLGNGTTGNSSVPVQVNSLSGIIAVAGGGFHCLALKSDGTVWAWGRNDTGQLGNGTTSNSTIPVQVKNLSGILAIERGRSHSLAAKSDGTVWAWGDNSDGQLGNGSTSNSSTPVQVKNLSGITSIAGGGFHSLGLKSEGTVWAWGQNDFGQLGDGTTKDKTTPVQVFVDLSITTGNIGGQVTDVTNGAGINNAIVTLDNQTQTTTSSQKGQDGVYAFQNVSAGTHILSVQATGYTTSTQTITVEEGQPNPKTGKNIFNFALTGSGIPTPTPTPGTGNIGGQVTDVTNGAGINNAIVTLDNQTQTTTSSQKGQDGVYAFQNVSAGTHILSVQATGYETSTQTITVEEGQPNPKTGKNIFNFALTGTGVPTPTPTPVQGKGNLGGQVTDAKTGIGIVGATVSTDTGLTTTTVNNGAYAFRDIDAGNYTLTTSASGYTTDSKSATVVADKNTRVDFALTSAGTPTPIPTPPSTPTPAQTPTPETGNLGGQVTDAETGIGIVGATVSADTGLTTTTVKNGAYSFRDIDAGDYIVTVFATGYDLDSQTATVVAGKNTRADFALTPQTTPIPTPTGTPSESGNIVGAVTDDETGAGIIGATVSTDTGLTTTTVKNGAYAFRNIATGDYTLTASAIGYITDSQSVTVEVDETTRADFALTPQTTPIPTPSPLCQAEAIAASSKTLQLNKGESDEETITVLCANSIPLAGETITWKIKSGKKRITITPESAITDANGEAQFTITATEKAGEAKIKFEDVSAGLKTTVTVKVKE